MCKKCLLPAIFHLSTIAGTTEEKQQIKLTPSPPTFPLSITAVKQLIRLYDALLMQQTERFLSEEVQVTKS